MMILVRNISTTFLEQLSWRFSNLPQFEWTSLIHPTKFEERNRATAGEQRELIERVRRLYPFVVTDVTATEYNLNVLYNSIEVLVLLKRLVRERDALVAKKRAKRRSKYRRSRSV